MIHSGIIFSFCSLFHSVQRCPTLSTIPSASNTKPLGSQVFNWFNISYNKVSRPWLYFHSNILRVLNCDIQFRAKEFALNDLDMVAQRALEKRSKIIINNKLKQCMKIWCLGKISCLQALSLILVGGKRYCTGRVIHWKLHKIFTAFENIKDVLSNALFF